MSNEIYRKTELFDLRLSLGLVLRGSVEEIRRFSKEMKELFPYIKLVYVKTSIEPLYIWTSPPPEEEKTEK